MKCMTAGSLSSATSRSTSDSVNRRKTSRSVSRKTCIRARVVLLASVALGRRYGQATATGERMSLGVAPRVLVVEHGLSKAEDLFWVLSRHGYETIVAAEAGA